jgi:hypothetical protein
MGYAGFVNLIAGRMELSTWFQWGVIPYSLPPADADPAAELRAASASLLGEA